METNTLRKWMFDMGFEWKPGHEELMKGEITKQEAVDTINDLYRQGKVVYKSW